MHCNLHFLIQYLGLVLSICCSLFSGIGCMNYSAIMFSKIILEPLYNTHSNALAYVTRHLIG